MDWMQIGGIIVVGLFGLWGGWKAWVHIPRKIGEAFLELADAVEDGHITLDELRHLVERPDIAALIAMIRKAIGR